MACSSCGRPRVSAVVNRNSTVARSATTAGSRIVESQSIQARPMKAIASNPNSAKRTKV